MMRSKPIKLLYISDPYHPIPKFTPQMLHQLFVHCSMVSFLELHSGWRLWFTMALQVLRRLGASWGFRGAKVATRSGALSVSDSNSSSRSAQIGPSKSCPRKPTKCTNESFATLGPSCGGILDSDDRPSTAVQRHRESCQWVIRPSYLIWACVCT